MHTGKLDILFVVDTSDSLNSERTRVARQMDYFIQRLNPATDYHIAVMLAHAPADRDYPCFPWQGKDRCHKVKTMPKHNKMGQLYVKNRKDRAVLDYSEILSEILNKAKSKGKDLSEEAASAAAKKKIIDMLEEKMLKPPVDESPAEGELGLYNIYKAVTVPELRSAIVSQGMFRPDATLAVLFISDEQDVCYDYHRLGGTPNFENKFGKVKKPDAYGIERDPVEQWTYDNICNDAVNGQRLEPDNVLAAVSEFKAQNGGMPLLFSGAVYVKDENIPRCSPNPRLRKNCPPGKPVDLYADEKEIGRGYLDLIERTHMNLVDLAADEFGSQLAEVGSKVASIMEVNNSFDCELSDGSNVDDIVKSIDSQSFKIDVEGSGGQVVAHFDSSCKPGTECNGAYGVEATDWYRDNNGRAHIKITVPAEVLKEKLGNADGNVRMSFNALEKKRHVRPNRASSRSSEVPPPRSKHAVQPRPSTPHTSKRTERKPKPPAHTVKQEKHKPAVKKHAAKATTTPKPKRKNKPIWKNNSTPCNSPTRMRYKKERRTLFLEQGFCGFYQVGFVGAGGFGVAARLEEVAAVGSFFFHDDFGAWFAALVVGFRIVEAAVFADACVRMAMLAFATEPTLSEKPLILPQLKHVIFTVELISQMTAL